MRLLFTLRFQVIVMSMPFPDTAMNQVFLRCFPFPDLRHWVSKYHNELRIFLHIAFLPANHTILAPSYSLLQSEKTVLKEPHICFCDPHIKIYLF